MLLKDRLLARAQEALGERCPARESCRPAVMTTALVNGTTILFAEGDYALLIDSTATSSECQAFSLRTGTLARIRADMMRRLDDDAPCPADPLEVSCMPHLEWTSVHDMTRAIALWEELGRDPAFVVRDSFDHSLLASVAADGSLRRLADDMVLQASDRPPSP